VDLPDAYLSVSEALRAGGFAHRARVEIRWVPSDECQTPAGAAKALAGVDGVLIPGGFGVRGIEGKIGAAAYARRQQIPTLGLCLGLQCMVIEAARELAGLAGANSAEFDPDSPHPVIATMADQVDVVAGERDMGGTMRLGTYPAALRTGSLVAQAYGGDEAWERHRHRYEVNNGYRDRLEQAGLRFSGTSPDRRLVEFVELPREVHPFYVGTQAHPELKSRPTRPHPLFRAFIHAAIAYSEAVRLPVELPDDAAPPDDAALPDGAARPDGAGLPRDAALPDGAGLPRDAALPNDAARPGADTLPANGSSALRPA
jgi:CTP synthase